ncbi:MAG: DUF2182 domain-containing protein [Pseudomonadota bacterium]
MRRFQAFRAQLFSGPLITLITISFGAFVLLWMLQHGFAAVELSASDQGHSHHGLTFPMGYEMLNWCVMVIAMMTPLVAHNLSYVRSAVDARIRGSVALAFLLGYWAVWCVTGLFLMPLTALILALADANIAFLIMILGGLIYSASPIAQLGRNLCHQSQRLEAFGAPAQWSSARYGLVTGMRCTLVCWPWMIVPMLALSGHMAAMIIVTVFLFFDRLSLPTKPAWRIPPALGTVFGPRLGVPALNGPA